ncbi:MAG: hypothetical protein CMJ46_10645, partial [Planctomyces sp.]|nr:hypothetical protein [Planctomyces sp.]
MMLTNWLQNFQSRYPGSAASARRNRHFHPAQVAISNDVERLEDKCMLSSVLISIEKPIATATDDAEERETESVSRFDSTLDIPDRGGKDQIIGLRFTDVEIPEDAVIRRAYVQFTADGNSSGTANVNIRGELSSESETFAGTSGDLSLRTRTNTAINWSPSDWLLNGDQTSAQATPDLTPIIQELINQADWSSDSAITFLMEGDGTRNARAFDAGSGAPVLHIDYIVDANYYEKEYLVVHTPRLQQGNVALDGFGFAGTDKDQIQIMMQTQRTGNNNVNDTLMLEYRKVGATNWNTGTWSTTSAGQSGVELHTASLTGLDYGTEYEYRVRQYIESGELVEEWEATFQTRLAKGDATEFSFAAFGNSSANPVGNDDILANTRQLMERLGTTDARFSLLVGNSINPNGSYSDADGRFEYFINPEGAEWLGSHVEYTAYGPDEINSGAADLYYSNPEIIEGVTSPFYNPVGEQLEENYSFDYGDTHFATFNSNVWDNE